MKKMNGKSHAMVAQIASLLLTTARSMASRLAASRLSTSGRAAGHQQPISQHMVDGRPADRRHDATLTRREHPLISLIRIDDKAYRLMGTSPRMCRP